MIYYNIYDEQEIVYIYIYIYSVYIYIYILYNIYNIHNTTTHMKRPECDPPKGMSCSNRASGRTASSLLHPHQSYVYQQSVMCTNTPFKKLSKHKRPNSQKPSMFGKTLRGYDTQLRLQLAEEALIYGANGTSKKYGVPAGTIRQWRLDLTKHGKEKLLGMKSRATSVHNKLLSPAALQLFDSSYYNRQEHDNIIEEDINTQNMLKFKREREKLEAFNLNSVSSAYPKLVNPFKKEEVNECKIEGNGGQTEDLEGSLENQEYNVENLGARNSYIASNTIGEYINRNPTGINGHSSSAKNSTYNNNNNNNNNNNLISPFPQKPILNFTDLEKMAQESFSQICPKYTSFDETTEFLRFLDTLKEYKLKKYTKIFYITEIKFQMNINKEGYGTFLFDEEIVNYGDNNTTYIYEFTIYLGFSDAGKVLNPLIIVDYDTAEVEITKLRSEYFSQAMLYTKSSIVNYSALFLEFFQKFISDMSGRGLIIHSLPNYTNFGLPGVESVNSNNKIHYLNIPTKISKGIFPFDDFVRPLVKSGMLSNFLLTSLRDVDGRAQNVIESVLKALKSIPKSIIIGCFSTFRLNVTNFNICKRYKYLSNQKGLDLDDNI